MTNSMNSIKCTKPYQISFIIEELSRCESSTTKKISWKFGLPSLNTEKQEPSIGENGEEHLVRLLWSSDPTGVARVTLCSSKAISPPPSWEPDTIRTIKKDAAAEFTWKTQSLQEIRVVAYSVPSPLFRQYELLIDGVSFFDFEERSIISQHPLKHVDELKFQAISVKEPTLVMDTLPHDIPIPKSAERTRSCEHIFSFDKYESFDSDGDTCEVSELGSSIDPADDQSYDTYANIIPDTPKEKVIYPLDRPSPKSIVSQAIDLAFSDEESIPQSHPHTDSSSIEANALCDAYDFMRRNALSKKSMDNSINRISFVHDQLTQMVNDVRFGAMSPIAAARTIHSIQMITGLAEFPSIWEVTVVFFGLKDMTTSLELRTAMEQFGKIEAVAVEDSGKGFGFCSFKSSSSAWHAIQSCRNREILLHGEPLCAMRIQNGNWLDPFLLSPSKENKIPPSPSTNDQDEIAPFSSTSMGELVPPPPSSFQRDDSLLSPLTPKRNNLSLPVETDESCNIPDPATSEPSSPIPTVPNTLSPKKTPIRFLRSLFKSPKPSFSEIKVDDDAPPLMPVLDDEESDNCCDNRPSPLLNDDTNSYSCPENLLFPPMIIRDASITQDKCEQNNPPIIVRRRRSSDIFPRNNIICTHRPCKSDTPIPKTYEMREEPFRVPYDDLNGATDYDSSIEPVSVPCSPAVNNAAEQFSTLPSDSRNSRSSFFALSPLKPKGLFSRRN